MNIDDYIKNVKSQLCCNQTGVVDYITYNYTNQEIDDNMKYFNYCFKEDLSGYKALLFFSDYLSGDYNIKSYQIVTNESEFF